MTNDHLLFLGAGYTAKQISPELLNQGWTLSGTTRSSDKASTLTQFSITPLVVPLSGDDLNQVADIVVSTPPDKDGCPSLEMLRNHKVNFQNLRTIIYYSTTGVYGDHQGAWVDEDTEPTSQLPRSQRRLQAEQDWLTFGSQHNIPVYILRLSGIYGPERNALERLKNNTQTVQRIFKKDHVFNRIHVADIGLITTKILHKSTAGVALPHQIYNLADDLPAVLRELLNPKSELLGQAPPPPIDFEDASLSKMAKSFYTETKRIKNDRIKDALTVELNFPTYKEGLTKHLHLD